MQIVTYENDTELSSKLDSFNSSNHPWTTHCSPNSDMLILNNTNPNFCVWCHYLIGITALGNESAHVTLDLV